MTEQQPVAWMIKAPDSDYIEFRRFAMGPLLAENGWTETPLYTRPSPSSDMVEAMQQFVEAFGPVSDAAVVWAKAHRACYAKKAVVNNPAAIAVIAEALAAKDAQIATLQKECDHWCSLANQRQLTVAAKDAELAERDARIRVLEEALDKIATWCPNTGGRLFPPTIALAALGSAKQ